MSPLEKLSLILYSNTRRQMGIGLGGCNQIRYMRHYPVGGPICCSLHHSEYRERDHYHIFSRKDSRHRQPPTVKGGLTVRRVSYGQVGGVYLM